MPSRRPAHINPTPKTVPAHLACSPDNQTTAASRMFGSADFADCPPLGNSPLPALQAATSIRPKKNSGGPILLWLTAKVSGWLKASPLERRVRPEGQKGAPSLEDVRGP